MNLVKICAETPQFEFNGTFYRQQFGLAMGSPLSPLLACMFMEEFETRALAESKVNVEFYARYVDDCFLVAKKADDLDMFLNELNQLDPNDRIQFTVEAENDKKLSFLDCLIERTSEGIELSVYHKATDTGRFTHFKSFQPMQHKIGTISNLSRRNYQIASKIDAAAKEECALKDNLSKCGYPVNLVQKNLDVFCPRRKPKEKPMITVALPYYNGLSSKISRYLGRFGVKCYMQKGVSLGNGLYKNSPKVEPKNVIYSIPCADCNASYIGKTTRHLNYRTKEHISAVGRKKDQNHPLYKHVMSSGHSIDFGSVHVIERSSQPDVLNSKEQLLIESCEKSVNQPDRRPHPSLVSVIRKR